MTAQILTNKFKNFAAQSRAAIDILIPEAWKLVTLVAPFVNFSTILAGYPNLSVRKDYSGLVHMKGAIAVSGSSANLAVNSTLFTLPVGYRPAEVMTFAVGTLSSGGSSGSAGIVQISAAGVVTAYSNNLGGSFIALDGIRFYAA